VVGGFRSKKWAFLISRLFVRTSEDFALDK
jgi:hypothetical protein